MRFVLILSGIVLALATPCPAEAAGLGQGIEGRLVTDALDGRLDHHTLLRAALIAGGTDISSQIDRYERQFATIRVRLLENKVLTNRNTPVRRRAGELLA